MPGRVLYVYDGKMTGVGIDLVVKQELLALVEGGFEVDLIARGPTAMPGVTDLVQRYSLANLISWLPRRYYYPSQKRRLSLRGKRQFTRRVYQAVFSWPQRALHVFRAAGSAGVPCFLNCDTIHYAKGRRPGRQSYWPEFRPFEFEDEYRLARLILVTSKVAKESFADHGISKSKLAVIGRGVDTEVYLPGDHQKSRPFRVLFCGRVGERKGIRQVLEAWTKANLPDAELWVVGDIAEEVKDLTSHPPNRVTYFSFQANPANYMRQCDVQILLSRHEGMAKSLLEGAACGLATIATPETGFPLQDAGFTVARNDTQAIAEHLRELEEDRPECLAKGRRGREQVLSGYSWSSFRKTFLNAVLSRLG